MSKFSRSLSINGPLSQEIKSLMLCLAFLKISIEIIYDYDKSLPFSLWLSLRSLIRLACGVAVSALLRIFEAL